MRALRRLLYWIRLRANDDALREELATHHALLQADIERRGLDPHDAHDAARSAMGNETLMREEARGVWLAPSIEALVQDWRYALRGLRRAPVFALVAVVSLGIGIGANTAIFGLVHALLLSDVPVPSADELMQPRRQLSRGGFDDRFSYEEARALDAGPLHLASFASSGATAEVDGSPLSVTVDAVDGSYFDVVRAPIASGRGLSPSDDADAAHTVVVTERFWRVHLNGDPAALGRTIKIHEQPFTVVGVTRRGFAGLRFPATADMMIPYHTATTIGLVRDANGRAPTMNIVGRRPPGQSAEQVGHTLAPLWERCCADGHLFGVPNGQVVGRAALAVREVRQGIPHPKLDLRGEYRKILLAMMAGVAILLLAACANVANLLLARSSARMGELAVRLALGASRTRLVMQLAIESIQLSLLGAALGLLLARWATTILARSQAGDLSAIIPETMAVRVLVFTMIVSLACGVVFGVMPALRVMRSDLITPLKQGGRRASNNRAWADRGLVALQMALALLLVSGATLLVQTLRNLQHTDLGFDPAQRVVMTVETRRTPYERSGMTAPMVDQMLDKVRAIPGVGAAGFGSSVPIQGGRSVSDVVSVPGVDAAPGADPQTSFVGVTPGYFAALGIALIAGHDIGPPTTVSSLTTSRDVIVNEAFAQKYFAGKNAIGRVFTDNDEGDTAVTTDRIVGVVANARYISPRTPAEPTYYVQVANGDWPFLMLILRPVRDASSIAGAVSRALISIAPGIGRPDPVLLSETVRSALARERLSATLATLFGAIALLLVAVGLYGVMLYQVAERTTEIGIRMALGARGASVIRLVLRDSFVVAGVGVAVGVPLALIAGRAVAAQLYGVAPYSIGALAVGSMCLVAVTVAASLIPVYRAVRIDPLTALRAE